MSRPARVQKPLFVCFALSCVAVTWWGCATSNETTGTTSGSTSASSGSTGSSSSTGSSGTGGIDVNEGGTTDEAGACTSTSAEAHPIPLDIVFVIDRSGSLSGPKWDGTKSALKQFFNDPKSASIGAGILYFPNYKSFECVLDDYVNLTVPINVLSANAFALTNSLPADANGNGTPTFASLRGALLVATAYQDLHPTHKVVVVLSTDGEPNSCEPKTDLDIQNLAKSARNYNGVLTYVIGAEGSIIANLNKIAEAGGTGAAYDITNDISDFSAKMEEIRSAALGCEFEIPKPPSGEDLDPSKVNFTYMPKGMGAPKILLRADDLADCKALPGWYYDSNLAPTKIILCPASCSTVQADATAKVSVLFGCKSQVN